MLKQKRLFVNLIGAMVVGVFIAACGGATTSSNPTTGGNATSTTGSGGTSAGGPKCVTGSLTASGSTALAPLVQPVAKDYQSKCPGANITVNLGGSKTGLANVEAGSVQIGNSDLFANPATQSDLVDHQVAAVIFVLAINSKVTGVTNLTTDQIKSIYSGKVTNWKDLGGPDLPIVVVSRPASSGTRGTFQQYILDGPETIKGPANLTSDSTGTVIQNINQTPGAIGYAASGPAKKAGVALLTIDGHAPTTDLVKNNTYKFWNIEHMYTKGKPTDLAQALIDYMSSDAGKQQATALDFIALADLSSAAVQAHQK